MPDTSSEKKQSLMPSSPLRKKLRGAGHGLSAVVMIGKVGFGAPIAKQVQQALSDHELIKIKIGSECPQDRFEIAGLLSDLNDVHIVQVVGRNILAYQRDPRVSRFE